MGHLRGGEVHSGEQDYPADDGYDDDDSDDSSTTLVAIVDSAGVRLVDRKLLPKEKKENWRQRNR